jgi:kynurenine 3-monooxygenase
MAEQKKQEITIIGAGIVGCFLAILFAKRGYKVHIYERISKEEIISSSTKRSFNLTFYDFGVSALKKAELWEIIEPTLVKARGSRVQVAQNPAVNRYIPVERPQYVVQRGFLIGTLMKEATNYSSVTFHFNTSLLAVDRHNKTIIVQHLTTKAIETITCDVIFGADGAHSTVRAFIQQGQEASHKLEYPQWVYKQLSFTPEQAQAIKLEHDVIYTWSRKNASLLAHPNYDKSFSSLLILPRDPEKGFAQLTSAETIRTFFEQNFSDFLPVLPSITEDILNNPIANFVSISTDPWYYKDFMTILGDAAHGFLPFYGQGVSAGFGDCLKLMELIETYPDDWEQVFSHYQKARKPHMDALGNLSKEALRLYSRTKKAHYPLVYIKFESLLHELWPKLFIAPTAPRVAIDPGKTADYIREHKRQRKLTNLVGAPLLVLLTTGLIGLHEEAYKLIKKVSGKK